MQKKRFDYTPLDIEQMTRKEIRKTYSELRKVATLRQKRLKAAFPRSALTGTGKWWKFPATKSMKSTQKVAEALAEVSRFLTNPLTTVKAQKSMIEELGTNFAGMFKIQLPKSEIPVFFDFIDELRARYEAKMVDSKRVAQVYQQMQRMNISEENIKKNLGFFLENLEKIKKLKPSNRQRPFTAKELRDRYKIGDPKETFRTSKPPIRSAKKKRRRGKK